MDYWQKEQSSEVSKEQYYLSYIALEVVLLLYAYILIGQYNLKAYRVSIRA